VTISRIASLIVAAGLLIAAALLVRRDGPGLATCVLVVLVPVPLIWFPDALGRYTGPAELGSIGRPTPGIMIAVVGWVWLAVISPLVIAIYS